MAKIKNNHEDMPMEDFILLVMFILQEMARVIQRNRELRVDSWKIDSGAELYPLILKKLDSKFNVAATSKDLDQAIIILGDPGKRPKLEIPKKIQHILTPSRV